MPTTTLATPSSPLKMPLTSQTPTSLTTNRETTTTATTTAPTTMTPSQNQSRRRTGRQSHQSKSLMLLSLDLTLSRHPNATSQSQPSLRLSQKLSLKSKTKSLKTTKKATRIKTWRLNLQSPHGTKGEAIKGNREAIRAPLLPLRKRLQSHANAKQRMAMNIANYPWST